MNKRIAVLRMHDENYREMAEITLPNVSGYCKLHGYTLIDYFIENPDNGRPASWQKIAKSIELAESGEFDWIFFLDLDCLIMNTSIQLESIIDNQFSMVVAAHAVRAIDFPMLDNGFGGDNVNGGVFLIRCDDAGKSILRDVWDKNGLPEDFDGDAFDYEQRQFRITLSKPEFRRYVKIVEERTLNTFWHVSNPAMVFNFIGINDIAWRPGDFVVHVTCYSVPERLSLLRELSNYSGGMIGKFRREESLIHFSPVINLENTNIVIKDTNGNVLTNASFDSLDYRVNYWIWFPGDYDEVIFEANDSSGKIISKKII